MQHPTNTYNHSKDSSIFPLFTHIILAYSDWLSNKIILFYYYFIFLSIENYPVIYIKTWNSYSEIQVTLSFFLPRFLIWGNSDFPQIDGQFQIELQNSYT